MKALGKTILTPMVIYRSFCSTFEVHHILQPCQDYATIRNVNSNHTDILVFLQRPLQEPRAARRQRSAWPPQSAVEVQGWEPPGASGLASYELRSRLFKVDSKKMEF